MSDVARYRARASAHAASRDVERRTSAVLSRWRLATFLPAAALSIWGIAGGRPIGFLSAGVLFLAFGILVVRHARVDERAARLDALRVVNERAIARIERRWEDLPAAEAPADVTLEGHPYAIDLDLFGRASLFQWLGPAATSNGAVTLARWLLAPAPPAEIEARQEAVEDLAPRDSWREHLAAFGVLGEHERAMPASSFLSWTESRTPPLPFYGAIRAAVYVIVALLWTLIALDVLHVTKVALWPIPLVISIVLSFVTAAPLTHAFAAAGTGQYALKQYAPLFAHMVAVPFTGAKLSALQRRLQSDVEPAPASMRRLNRILDFAALRQSAAILHFPIQAFTLWDFHVLFALERWRRATGPHVRDWLEATGEIDALSLLAAARHDNPGWCRPQIETDRVVRGRALGHPLIPEDRRVANDVSVGPQGTVLLVTGSNMSGKSTLLRAIGLNTVLAQAGANVCAAELSLPPCELQSSIRIQDSLERGISYFMAALSRLKGVVDAAEHQPSGRVLLYLLDEILQGTNSAERAIAVQAVARHLLDAGAIGVMTTHDLSLADEEPLRSAAVLVHFTEIVDDDGSMRFDYTLRPGIATSRNALRLMRLIGIR